ncbi:MAG: hypothetical protein QUS11_01260 [Candidatus Fermentibacter sp.]|nr:hypothetical protein [Candidatus Fermentibacter sp.]
MRYLILAALAAVPAFAQTQFEFGVVESLIEGDPFVSVMRIDISAGTPAPGCNTLEISTRAGLDLRGTGLSLCVDTVGSSGMTFQGQSLFDIDLLSAPFDRVLDVILAKDAEFPSTGITHVRLDLVSYDDMSWVSLSFPLGLADSLRRGLVDREQFWSMADVSMLEVGTASTPLEFRPPLAFQLSESRTVTEIVEEPVERGGQAWKSLILPGWGQISSGEGIGWVNLLVEAGAVGLYLSDYEEEGLAVLGTNHVISFFDLL